MDDLSHVTIPAVQKRENEKLRQVDNYGRLMRLCRSVEPEGIRGYLKIKKTI
ncbi:hypothetical protein [Methanosarcina vacuolata]|uniref:hypothetical protein n=1 Tax=Methanosarcina vacuolata TaxID=2215 RepID=UPI000A647C5C|nr:hypothetical protein [Methanosarcina vacuolata]